jgi:hypothetical protein
MNKQFDIIIPTMWAAKDFLKSLEKYISYDSVRSIIIIDNNKSRKPKTDLLRNNKIQIIDYGFNTYVNPAWNEGVYVAKSNLLCIANDDIIIDESIFKMVYNHNLKTGDLVGVNLRGYHDNYKIDDYIETDEKIVYLNYDRTRPIGSQAWAFGICMFMQKDTYCQIPSLYKVWFGDDYLAQKAKKIYALNTNRIKGTISETLKRHDHKTDIHKRLILDCKNLIRFDHFENGKNWDIPKNMISANYEQTPNNVLESEYNKARNVVSDINENVHILYDLAKECTHVTEMGVRTGVSTRALLYSGVNKLISYDLNLDSKVESLFKYARSIGRDAEYIKADVLKIEIEETDLLFIDTYHTYSQLKQELQLHGNKARKYLAFHDTMTFGLTGENTKERNGLLSAIIEFIIKNPQWRFKVYKTNNNGFTVLERVMNK